MRPNLTLVPFLPFSALLAAGIGAACGDIPVDPPPPAGQGAALAAVIEGTVVYSGPHPCSMNGHIVGAAILFVFDQRNPPPPSGTASTPVNFAVVTGDALFPNEPRNPGSAMDCPADNGITDTITVSSPFSIAPINGGAYLLQAFYDSTGDFLPTFKFRNLPEQGDIGGGDIDTADALKAINAGNPNYLPKFIPVTVGTPEALAGGDSFPGEIPNYVVDQAGLVVGNVTVTLGEALPMARPYFYAGGMSVLFDASMGTFTTKEPQTSSTPPPSLTNIHGTTSTDKNSDPILTIPQDIAVLASPVDVMTPGNVNHFESSLPRLILHAGLPAAELPAATAQPFHFQLGGAAPGAFSVWQDALFDSAKAQWVAQDIPEGNGIPSLWPLVVLTKLIDDPSHTLDPASVTAQGSPTAPVVILQGITLLGGDGTNAGAPDTLYNTAQAESFGLLFNTNTGQPKIFSQDHLTVLLRPAVICFDTLYDATNPDKRGTLVTPYIRGTSADLTNPTSQPIVPPTILQSPQLSSLLNGQVVQGCLPTGRYAINVVYPDGQAWTVPNEAGACLSTEGATDYAHLTCTIKPRPILYSQGTRAVVEVVKATDPKNCLATTPAPAPPPTPGVCLPTGM
jgi:hypothetical protein